jgi:hypothetical protein
MKLCAVIKCLTAENMLLIDILQQMKLCMERSMLAKICWQFLGSSSMVHSEVMPIFTTVNSEQYCETPKNWRLWRVCSHLEQHLHQDIAQPHTYARTVAKLGHLGFTIFDHSPYSPRLVSSDFHLFHKQKEHLRGHHCVLDIEVKRVVNLCFHHARFYCDRLLNACGSV